MWTADFEQVVQKLNEHTEIPTCSRGREFQNETFKSLGWQFPRAVCENQGLDVKYSNQMLRSKW